MLRLLASSACQLKQLRDKFSAEREKWRGEMSALQAQAHRAKGRALGAMSLSQLLELQRDQQLALGLVES